MSKQRRTAPETLAGYNLKQINDLIIACHTAKTPSPKIVDELLNVFHALNTMMTDSDPISRDLATRWWFRQIIPKIARMRYCTGVNQYAPQLELLTLGASPLLETAVQSNDPHCIQTLEHYFKSISYTKLRDGDYFIGAYTDREPLVRRLFRAGHFNLVILIFAQSTFHDINSYDFPIIEPEQGVEKQCEAYYFFHRYCNQPLILQRQKIQDTPAAHDYITKKIDELVDWSNTRQYVSEPMNKLVLWATCDYNLGNKSAFISTYRKLNDKHKSDFLAHYFNIIGSDAQKTRDYFEHRNKDEKATFVTSCGFKLEEMIPHVHLLPYDLISQEPRAGRDTMAHSLLHYWLIDKRTTENIIERWVEKNARQKNWADPSRSNLLIESCLYYKERANNPKEFRSIFGGVSKSDKLNAIKKLHSCLLDESTPVNFTENEEKALKQGRFKAIYNRYKLIIDPMIKPPDVPSTLSRELM